MVEMVLAEGNIDYQLREIDILKNEHRSTEFLKINPFGWVPALITTERVVLIHYLNGLVPFAVMRQCMNWVMSRPKLQSMFEYQIEWNKESLQSAKAPWSML